MKIGALIGFIFTAAGAFLRFLAFQVVTDSTLWTSYRNFASISNPNLLILLGNGAFTIGLTLLFLSSLVKSTGMMKIGSIFYLLAYLAEFVLYLFNQMFGIFLLLVNGFMVLSALFYLFGCIGFRKHNKLTIITGILIFLSALGIQGVLGIILMIQWVDNASFISVYFLALAIQGFLWTLHALLFSFSKKEVGWGGDDVEDTLSVESGGAFASYVPDEKKKKGKKKKGKGKGGDDFTFDF